jgi:anaerobic magnesium-protoporphyrin IX monomethyl ester cyclase
MKWFIETRVDTLLRDADLVPRMAKLGLFHVLLGAESSSENDLKYLEKGIDFRDTKKAVDLLKQNGIIAHANFILGLPTDTKRSIRQTVNFAKSVDPDMAVFVPFTPFPGTDLYDEIAKQGLLKETDFDSFDFIKPVASTNSLSRKQIQREIILAYTRFYARPTKTFRSLLNRNEMIRKSYIHVSVYFSTYMIRRFLKSEFSTG